MRKRYFSLSVLIVTGCMVSTGLEYDAVATNNLYHMAKIRKGMTERQVISIMRQPFLYETYEFDEDMYDVWFYVTQTTVLDQTTMVPRNLTPLSFKNGILVGTGYSYYYFLLDEQEKRWKAANPPLEPAAPVPLRDPPPPPSPASPAKVQPTPLNKEENIELEKTLQTTPPPPPPPNTPNAPPLAPNETVTDNTTLSSDDSEVPATTGFLEEDSAICCDAIWDYRPWIEECGFIFGVDYLCWKPTVDELNYVTKGAQPTIPGDEVPNISQGAQGNYHHAHYDLSSGLRLNAGYVFAPDFWSVESCYTWLHATGNDQVRAETLVPPSLNGAFIQQTGVLVKATSSIDLHYNVLDLFLARRFQLTPHMLFTFQYGATGAWIKQNWDIDYLGEFGEAFENYQWKFQGGGLRTGFATEWYCGMGFGISSKLTGAVLYGSYVNKALVDVQYFNALMTNNEITDATINTQRFTMHLQAAFGPTWGTTWGNTYIRITPTYELNLWFNLQEVQSPQTVACTGTSCTGAEKSEKLIRNLSGNLGMQGLTLNVEVRF